MPNTSTPNSAVAIALNMLEGHTRFLSRNTAAFAASDSTDIGLVNTEDVVSNNRQNIGRTAMEGQPNGDGTTESQALMALGYAYAYTATKNRAYLALAERYWNAYFRYFYAGQRIPNSQERWISNWIVNAKKPVLANYPLNTTEPTEGGFLGTLVNFTNGVGQIPASGTTWGQYLDRATFAYVGVLGWNSIVASVYQDNGSGGPNYSVPGTKYDVDWIIAWTGEKIDSTGAIITSGHSAGEYGTVKLKNTSVNGNTKLNYTTRQPVANGGYMIARNEVQHNRPLHVPVNPSTVAFNRYRMGNSSDSEQWWADLCYLLWRITDNPKYKRALDSSLWTLREFAAITGGTADPEYGKAFQKSTTAGVFDLNTSYYYTAPGGFTVTYTRDSNGLALFTPPGSGVGVVMETQFDKSVGWRDTAYVAAEHGTYPSGSKPVMVYLRLGWQDVVGGDIVYYTLCADPFQGAPYTNNYGGHSLFREDTQDGGVVPWARFSRTDWYGGGVMTRYWTDDIGEDADTGEVVRVFFPDDDAGMIISFADQPGGTYQPDQIQFRSDAEFDVRIVDDNGWRWYWILPDTGGNWSWFTLDKNNMTLSGYQPGATGQTPTHPTFTRVADYTIILENSGDTNRYFEYFIASAMPQRMDWVNTGFIKELSIEFDCETSYTARVGNLSVMNPVPEVISALAYTPGVIPFSNLYDVATGVIDSTNGLPYPGYQNPVVWSYNSADETKLLKMVDFLHAAQAAYNTAIGQLGPVMSAYIWDIPQMLAYGPKNTWTMFHWGTDKAWSGYQPRAFFAGARCYQEIAEDDEIDQPAKLITYLTNWLNWLWTYYNQYGIFPTDFPTASSAVPLPNDFTGHMTGLWLAGCAALEIAGFTHPKLKRLSDAAVAELSANYRNVSSIGGTKFNGFWTGYFNETTPDKTSVYGFWSGEILRGLSLYAMARNRQPNKDLYRVATPDPYDQWLESRVLYLDGTVDSQTSKANNYPYNPKTITRSQGVTMDTGDKQYGTAALSFSGSNSGILFAAHPDFHMPRRFTIRFWIKSSNRGGFIMSLGGGSMIAWSSFQFVWQEGQYINFAASSANAGYDIGSEGGAEGRLNAAIAANTWAHVQVCQDGDVWYGFVNGQLVWFRSYFGKDFFNPVTRGLLIGANYTDVWDTATMTNCMAGKLQHLEIYKGVCLNTANFAVPTAPTPFK